MKEYKVLAQSDSFWRDRFSPAVLEAELNKLARSGWRVVACTSTEFTGLGGLGSKRHELFVMLERDVEVHAAPTTTNDEASDYDASRVPADRWYANLGNVSTSLQNAGLLSKEQMNVARAEFAKRGGHLCDHLIALGFVDDDALRAHFKRGVP